MLPGVCHHKSVALICWMQSNCSGKICRESYLTWIGNSGPKNGIAIILAPLYCCNSWLGSKHSSSLLRSLPYSCTARPFWLCKFEFKLKRDRLLFLIRSMQQYDALHTHFWVWLIVSTISKRSHDHTPRALVLGISCVTHKIACFHACEPCRAKVCFPFGPRMWGYGCTGEVWSIVSLG